MKHPSEELRRQRPGPPAWLIGTFFNDLFVPFLFPKRRKTLFLYCKSCTLGFYFFPQKRSFLAIWICFLILLLKIVCITKPISLLFSFQQMSRPSVILLLDTIANFSHAGGSCNPSCLGGWDWEVHHSSSAQANSSQDPNFKIIRAKCTGGVAQVVEYLLCKWEALSWNSSLIRKKKYSEYILVNNTLSWRMIIFYFIFSFVYLDII
jgi:hypothetical protein